MSVRSIVSCAMCGTSINRVTWNYAKNRPITDFFCNTSCKGAWQKSQRERLGFTKEWLLDQYVTQGKSANQVAREISRDPKRVWEWIVDYGISTRPRGTDYGYHIKKGQSSFFKGKKHTAETKRKLSEIAKADGRIPYKIENGPPMMGKKGPQTNNWKGGATPERQALYSSKEWVDAVKKVWKRDGAKCQKCGAEHNKGLRGTFHIHHIASFASSPNLRSSADNLVLLCKSCHAWVHSNLNTEKQFIREL